MKAADLKKNIAKIKEAENQSETCWDWIKCAESWIELKNPDNATRCAKKAESFAESYSDWIECAKVWLGGRDKYNFSKCMKKAFNNSAKATFLNLRYPNNLHKNIEEDYVKNIVEIEEKSKDNLINAEKNAQCAFDLISIAEAWIDFFNDSDSADRCLKRAEEKVEYLFFEGTIYFDWFNYTLGNWNNAKKCLQEAEKKSSSCYHWLFSTTLWKKFFNEGDSAFKCISEAEKQAVVFSDLINCSRLRFSLFEDRDNAIKYLKEAETLAENYNDWLYCAFLWSLLDDKSSEKKCINKAETKA